ncbi:MAG TPA: hypothetical protein VNX18_08335 [Bryobacteraceae bacterium]|jgi:outer membrane lipoprotein-sorting protein|nr:hypothetical protein [Bryobacteraceae bacterium]
MHALILAPVLFQCAVAQAQPNATELVRKIRDNYFSAGSFHFVATVELRELGPNGNEFNKHSTYLDLAIELPNKVHLEGDVAGFGPSVTVVDGENIFLYLKQQNKYFEARVAPPDTEVDERNITEKNISAYIMHVGRSVALGLQDTTAGQEQVTSLREDRLDVDGRSIDCWVVQIKGRPWKDAVSTWWIDRKRYVLIREDMVSVTQPGVESRSSTFFKSVSINEPLSDALFRFTPPQGAIKVSKLADLNSQ